MFQTIQTMDDRILRFVQNKVRCSFLDAVMPVITHIGTFGLPWLFAAVALVSRPSTRRSGLWLLFILGLCVLTGNLSIKPLVARARPCQRDPEVRLLVNLPRDYSFPSCHTLSSFASALVISLVNPLWGLVAFFMAALIGFSRVYLFVHYPSDVLAGAAMGLLMPWSVLLLVVRLVVQLHRRYRRNKAAY